MAIQIFMSVACKLLFIIGKNAVSGSDIVEKQFFLTDNELYQIVLLCSCICLISLEINFRHYFWSKLHI